jgi:hypothetical protein
MQTRSWIAAVALVGGTAVAINQGVATSQGETAREAPVASAPANKPASPAKPEAPEAKNGFSMAHVKLLIGVAGLEDKGCDIEVKSAHAGCRFRPVPLIHIDSKKGTVTADLRDVEIRGTDRLLSLAITVREGTQPPKTIYRAYRLSNKPSAGNTPPTFACYVSSPSKVARLEDSSTRKQ